jgi:hypothetical protein
VRINLLCEIVQFSFTPKHRFCLRVLSANSASATGSLSQSTQTA